MKKITYLIIMACFVALSATAQPINRMTTDKMVEVAEQQLAAGDVYNALSWYQQAFEKEEDAEVASKIAELHYALRDYKMAESWYAKMAAVEGSAASFDYARILKMNGKFDAAVKEFEKVLASGVSGTAKTLAQMEMKGATMAKSMEQSDKLTINDAGDVLNSPYTEFAAVAQGDAVYYGSLTSSAILTVEDDDLATNERYYAKIFKATESNGTWTEMELPTEINRVGFHTGNPTFSADGSMMYFTRTGLRGNMLSSSEIFVSSKSGDSWGAATKVEGLTGICKHPAVGEFMGKKVLYFAAEKEDSRGGWDIYYAPFESATKVGDAVNLGDAINTVGNEETPFYTNNTLHFSSTGHPGMGGYDVFASVHNGTGWSAPMNAGKGINSTQDDMYCTIDSEGLNGYVVSNRPSSRSLKSETCCDDIYTFSIEPVIVDLIVMAKDIETGADLGEVALQLTPKGMSAKALEQGKKTLLALGQAYTVSASLADYENASISFNTVGIENSTTLEKVIKLKAIVIPPPPPKEEYEVITSREPFVLDNILYALNSDEILPESEPDLEYLLGIMLKNPEMKIELSSHTDVRGSAPYNQNLSQRRSESAKNWLVTRGVTSDRISAVGYGETMPRNQCVEGVKCTDDEHKYNRRTEFRITEGPDAIISTKKVLKTSTGSTDEKKK